MLKRTLKTLEGIIVGAAVLLLLGLAYLFIIVYPNQLVDLAIAAFGLILVIAGIQNIRRRYWEHTSR